MSETAPASAPVPMDPVEEAFIAFASNSPVGIFVIQEGRFIFLNRQFLKITGYRGRDLVGKDSLSLVHPDDREKVRSKAIAMLKGERTAPYEYRTVRQDGDIRWVLETVTSVTSFGRRIAIGYFMDVTEKRETEEQLRSALSLQAATLESTADGLLIVDSEGQILSYNNRFVEMWRIPGDLVATRDDERAIAFVLNQLKDPNGFMERVRQLYSDSTSESKDVLEFIDGRIFERYSRPTQIDGVSVGRVWSFRDITDQRRAEAQLRELASRDPLTNLMNRRRFHEELEAWLRDPASEGKAGALLLLDLDQFKEVNDSLGHLVGDRLLAQVAALLWYAVPHDAPVARLGGDEFAVMLRGAESKEAVRIAHSVLRAISSSPLMVGGHRLSLSASIGVALYPDHGTSASELLSRVDLAMYQAKDSGRNRVAVFAPSRRPNRVESRLLWVSRIRDALRDGHFHLHAQPILDLLSGEVDHYELLLRMKDGTKLIPARSFIPLAERFGLVQEIDRWVVREATTLLSRLRYVAPEAKLAMNLSAKTLGDEEVLALLRAELASGAFDPTSLVIEVTESSALLDVARTRRFTAMLKGTGARFALDDFGAGFSSFYHLKQLQADILKIDASFIRELARSAVDQQLVRAIIDMAKGLGMETVAEHVSSAETLAAVRRLGVDYAQGWHIGRPRSVHSIWPLLTAAAA